MRLTSRRARDPGSLNDGLHLKFIWTVRQETMRWERKTTAADTQMIQTLPSPAAPCTLCGLISYIQHTSSLLPTFAAENNNRIIIWYNILKKKLCGKSFTDRKHEILRRQGVLKAHQWFGNAIFLSNITEISRAAGLEPDVVPKLSIVLWKVIKWSSHCKEKQQTSTISSRRWEVTHGPVDGAVGLLQLVGLSGRRDGGLRRHMLQAWLCDGFPKTTRRKDVIRK